MNEVIKELFYNPKTGFISAEKLHKKLVDYGYDIPLQQVKTVLNKQKVNQIFKPQGKQYYTSIIAKEPKHIYQADLLDVHQYSKFNNGFNWILVVIDVYSRFAMCVPLKNKTIDDVLDGFKTVFEELGKPDNLTTDLEASVMSDKFQKYLTENKITHYAIDPERKRNNAVVERFNRTLRERFRSVLFAADTNKWIEYLKPIVDNYNETYHSTIKGKPITVFLGKAKNNQDINKPVGTLFSINDKVRVLLKPKNIYSKGSTEDKFSSTIYKVIGTEGMRVKLQSADGEITKLPRELLKVESVDESPISSDSTAKKEMQQNQKEMKQSRLLKQVGIDSSNIVDGKRERKKKQVFDI